ncbi:MAG: YkgJ family cysteine cluster protein [Spirochaetales bacterium]|nr:YkgJ family cysteine cluster protein [Spirochaetales bacterium]
MKLFDCKCCGDCCSGLMDIKLNLYDLYKIAKHLNLDSTKQLFEKKIVALRDSQNGIKQPFIVFKKSPYKFCPFLINDISENYDLKGYCSLHPYIKPLVCILAPISREYDATFNNSKYFITIPTESCPGEFKGSDVEIDDILKPINEEILYENSFYSYLSIFNEKTLKENKWDIYYFDTHKDFSTIIKEITNAKN